MVAVISRLAGYDQGPDISADYCFFASIMLMRQNAWIACNNPEWNKVKHKKELVIRSPTSYFRQTSKIRMSALLILMVLCIVLGFVFHNIYPSVPPSTHPFVCLSRLLYLWHVKLLDKPLICECMNLFIRAERNAEVGVIHAILAPDVAGYIVC